MGLFCQSHDELLQKLSKARHNKKIVFTNGCFDLLHVGHIRYLQEAQKLGDLLVVALNSDSSVKKIKGPKRPVQTENDRAEILAALACVNFTTIFSEDTPQNIIEKIKPDILVKGGDWEIDKIVGADFVQASGGKVYSLQFIDGKSTTNLIQKAKEN